MRSLSPFVPLMGHRRSNVNHPFAGWIVEEHQLKRTDEELARIRDRSRLCLHGSEDLAREVRVGDDPKAQPRSRRAALPGEARLENRKVPLDILSNRLRHLRSREDDVGLTDSETGLKGERVADQLLQHAADGLLGIAILQTGFVEGAVDGDDVRAARVWVHRTPKTSISACRMSWLKLLFLKT
jgi:hypothetical protein